jgi:DNA-binding response OmpR family regulator
MNVLYLTEHISHADFLGHELEKLAPHIRLDVSPRVDDALARAATPGRYDALLLDPIIQGTESLGVIAHIRQQDLPLAVVVLTGPADADPPVKMLEAGADDYVVKRPNFVKNLLLILDRLVVRRRTEGEKDLPPLEVLHTGEIERARRHFTRPTLVKFRAMTIGHDGCGSLPPAPQGKFSFDAVVLDDATPGINLLRALKDIVVRAPDTPVILMVELGQDDVGVQGLKLGAAEYILKSGDYYHRLATALESAIRRRDLLREKAALRSTEARLRLIIETVPACVTLLTREGTFQAINWTGLSLVGATRVDQIVGKNLFSMVGPKQEGRLRTLIDRVCAGERGAVEFDWNGLDGVPRRLELRAVPLRREAEASPAVLGVIHDLAAAARKMPESQLPEAEPATAGLEEVQRVLQTQWDEERNKYEAERIAVLDVLRASEAKVAQMESERQAEQAAWQAARQEMEWQRTALEEALRTAEASHAQLVEQNRREHAEWENTRGELERQHQEAEKRWTQSLESAREPEAYRSGTEGQHAKAPGDLYPARPDLKQEHAESESSLAEEERLHASIEELLRSLEVSQGGAQDQSQTGRVEWEATRAELKPFLQMEAIHGAEARQAELEEQYRIERTEWDSACLELKRLRAEAEWNCAEMARQRASLESTLIEREARDGDSEIRNQAESADWENKRQEWEQQRASLMGTIGGLEQHLAENAEQHQIERAEWDSAWLGLKGQWAESEARCVELESRCAALEESLRALEARSSEIDDRSQSEQTAWEATRQHWEQQHREAEEQRAALEAIIRGLEARQAELVHQHRTERAEWERTCAELERQRSESDSRREELESRRAMHEEVLHTLETRCAELELQYQSELVGLEKIQQELEGREREVEERRTALETMMTGLEARLEESKHQHQAEQNEWQTARLELERQCSGSEEKRSELANRCAALEAALHALEARSAELESQYQSALAELETTRQVQEQQRRKAEEQRAGLDSMVRGLEAQNLEIKEQYQSGLAEWDRARQELERQQAESNDKRAELEGRRTALEEALHALEARCAELESRCRMEQAESAKIAQELERQQAESDDRRAELEGRRTALEEALHALEARCTELENRCRMEQAESAKIVQELERQHRDLADKNSMLEKALAAAEAHKTGLLEKHRLEQTNWERLREELEHQRAARVALEETLHASEARQMEIQEGQRTERAEFQTMREELERRRTARLTMEEELRASEARLTQLAEDHQREQAESEALRQELQRQRAARLALEGALRAAESRQRPEPFTGIASAAMQALSELVTRMNDCGELLMQGLDADDPRRMRAARLVEIAGLAGKLANRLLTLGHRKETVDLNLTVTQLTEPLRRLAGDNAELITVLFPRLPLVLAAQPAAEQLLHALVTHARDSLPLGGIITIETLQPSEAGVPGAGPSVLLAVSASGTNVQAPASTAALEPFATACGGTLRVLGDAITSTTIEVSLPAES